MHDFPTWGLTEFILIVCPFRTGSNFAMSLTSSRKLPLFGRVCLWSPSGKDVSLPKSELQPPTWSRPNVFTPPQAFAAYLQFTFPFYKSNLQFFQWYVILYIECCQLFMCLEYLTAGFSLFPSLVILYFLNMHTHCSKTSLYCKCAGGCNFCHSFPPIILVI